MSATSHERRRSRTPKTPKSCHDRALGLLAVRPRSRRELERRLLAMGFEPSEVSDVLARLERVGLIDDGAFARQVAEYQYGSRRAGRRAVTSALLAKGIAPEVVAAVVDESPDDEGDRALALARSRASRMAPLEPLTAFNRLTSFLVLRGYQGDVAREAARRALAVESWE
ncbi:MAG: regulatory protein RecX [Actinomycetota bacterium]